MKRYLKETGLVLAAAVLLVAMASGCRTVTSSSVDANGQTNIVTSRVPDATTVALIAGTAKSAAYLGTKIYLEGLPPRLAGHPEAREEFVLARNSVLTLLALGNFSAGDLTAALQNLPIKELQGETGTLIVGEAVVLWDSYGRQLSSLDKAQVFQGYIKPVAQAICEGLTMALGPPEPQ
jgi:hypothetical protein